MKRARSFLPNTQLAQPKRTAGGGRSFHGALLAFLLALAACTPAPPGFHAPNKEAGAAASCRVSRIVDGDTVYLACAPGKPRRARLMGFDTPEIFSAHCAAEKALGNRATDALRHIVAGASSLDLRFHGHDRYGRDLVEMFVDGRNVSQIMVAEGLAVPYYGHRRINWCARLASR